MRKLIWWGFSAVTIVTFWVGISFEIMPLKIAGVILMFVVSLSYTIYRLYIKH